MLQQEIRQARIDHGFSQAELARRAGVPRERVRQLESGGNVTMETFQKILAQLPRLEKLTIGSVELLTRGPNASQVRDALAAWLEAGRRLLTLLEQVPPEQGPAGATRFQPSVELTPELESRLRRLEAQFTPPGAAHEPQT
jgi:transcriptional regulator with XRE-family HTH domain